ncbi:MAG TPA: hypothetical protein PKH77_20435 [Anaerolineae bacterium]|nr:hypothetical protein [Anaerolineae bacterium]
MKCDDATRDRRRTPHTPRFRRLCLTSAIVFLYAIAIAGCTQKKCVCVETSGGTGRMCSKEDRASLESVEAPSFPISGTVDCFAQMPATTDAVSYKQGETVNVIVMIRTLGDCNWHIWATVPEEVDHTATKIERETNGDVPLTKQGQKWLESPEDFYRQCYDQPRICGSIVLSSEVQMCRRLQLNELFDLSTPGTYSVTLVRNTRHDELSTIRSNVISFTITP